MNLLIVDRIITDVMDLVIDIIVDRKMDKQVPRYVFAGVNCSLSQLGRFGLNNKLSQKQGEKQPPLTANKMSLNPIIDNRSTSKCKSIIVTRQHQNPAQNHLSRRYTRSISINSKLLINSSKSHFNSSNSHTLRNNQQQQNDNNNCIKLTPDPNDKQIQQMQMQQKLRRQLEISRLKIRKETQIIKTKWLVHIAAKDKLKNMKDFTFGYDFELLKSNHQQCQMNENTSQRSSRKVPQMKIRLSNQGLGDKNKDTSRHAKSTPQISCVQVPKNNRKQQSKLPALEITLNPHQTHSLLQTLLTQSSLNKGVTIKQHIDGHTLKFKKDTPTSKSLLDLNRSQFQFTTQRKRFMSKHYKVEKLRVNQSVLL